MTGNGGGMNAGALMRPLLAMVRGLEREFEGKTIKIALGNVKARIETIVENSRLDPERVYVIANEIESDAMSLYRSGTVAVMPVVDRIKIGRFLGEARFAVKQVMECIGCLV